MASPRETVEAIQRALDPFIRPREEAAHIRSVLAAHLGTSLSDGAITEPLGLAHPATTVRIPTESRGLQREYLKALAANVKAQEHYEAFKQQSRAQVSVSTTGDISDSCDRLDEHVSTIKLRKKRERLQAIIKYLDLLDQKPAASQDFLVPEQVFRGSLPLPEVPKNVVSGIVMGEGTIRTDLKELVDKLERLVLRSKLLLKKEEQLLEDVRAHSSSPPGAVSDGAKLAALNTTRNELINWIESELGKVSGEEYQTGHTAGGSAAESKADRAHMDEQLTSIKEKYARYTEGRKALIQLVSQKPQPVMSPPANNSDTAPALEAPRRPTNHLISPYVEALLLLAHEQKFLITHKSHLNVAIAKQMKDTCQALDHLAEESQLLPAHSTPGASQKKKAQFGAGLGVTESQDATSRVKKWAFAADSAKIATLENVAEKIEEGQVALEASVRALDEIARFLRRDSPENDKTNADTTNDDIWLAEGQSAAPKGAAARRRAQSKSAKPQDEGGIWSMLHGNLGLINSDEART